MFFLKSEKNVGDAVTVSQISGETLFTPYSIDKVGNK